LQRSAIKLAYTLNGKQAIILLLLIFAVFYLPFLQRYGWQYRNIESVDLPSFYAASISAFSFGDSPYDPIKLQSLMGSIYTFPFVYPPPSLPLFFPLSLVSYETARQVVLIVNHAIILMLAWTIPLLVLKARPSTDFFSIAVCPIFSFWFYPVMLTLGHGQINLLVLLWLGLAAATSFAIFPLSIWSDWVALVQPSSGYLKTPIGVFSTAIPINININGFFARAFTPSGWSQPLTDNPALGRLLAYLTAGVVLATTATTVWQSRAQPYALDRAILVSLPAMFLIAPFSWEHHVVYLLPCILAVLSGRHRGNQAQRILFHLAGIVSAFVLAVDGCMAYKFHAALLLWVLCMCVARCRQIELPMFDNHLQLPPGNSTPCVDPNAYPAARRPV